MVYKDLSRPSRHYTNKARSRAPYGSERATSCRTSKMRYWGRWPILNSVLGSREGMLIPDSQWPWFNLPGGWPRSQGQPGRPGQLALHPGGADGEHEDGQPGARWTFTLSRPEPGLCRLYFSQGELNSAQNYLIFTHIRLLDTVEDCHKSPALKFGSLQASSS